MGEDDKAIEALETAISLGSKYSNSFYYRGLALERVSKTHLTKAISDYGNALELSSDGNRAVIQTALDRVERAVEAITPLTTKGKFGMIGCVAVMLLLVIGV